MIFKPKYSLNFNVTEYCIISIDSRESKAKHVNIISRLRAEADKSSNDVSRDDENWKNSLRTMSRKHFDDIKDNNDSMECDIDDDDNGDSINHCGGGDIKIMLLQHVELQTKTITETILSVEIVVGQ